MRVLIVRAHPDLEADGLWLGTEADMAEARALSLIARGFCVAAASPRPPERQARARAPESKRGS